MEDSPLEYAQGKLEKPELQVQLNLKMILEEELFVNHFIKIALVNQNQQHISSWLIHSKFKQFQTSRL